MRAILIDDEPLSLELLERRIRAVSEITIAKKFTHFDLNENTTLLSTIDIIFLDIEMPDKNGLEYAEKISSAYPHIPIVFVTAYNHYATEAFELNAVDYILKPVSEERLKKSLQRVITKMSPRNEFHQQNHPGQSMYIHLEDELEFTLPNNTKKILSWRTARAKELFLYLLHYKNQFVRKTEIIDILWDEFNIEQAYAQLYTTVYHIRSTLKDFQQYIWIENVSDGYILTTDNVFIDIVEWENKVDCLTGVSEDTVHLYQEAMNAYGGTYLESTGYLWAESKKTQLREKWLRHAMQLANYFFTSESYENAETWLLKIQQMAPENEQAHFLLMKLYDRLGYGLLVSHQYNQLVEALQDLGLAVHPAIDNWYRKYKEKFLS